MSNHSLEYYAAIINYFLYQRVDDNGKILNEFKQPGLQTFPLLDVQALQEVKGFGPLSVVKILQLIHRHYSKYKAMPSETVYEDLIQNDPEFRLWFNDKATQTQRNEIQRIAIHLFQPVQDEAYYMERIKDLAVQVQIKTILEQTAKTLNEGKGRGAVALEQLYTNIFNYREKYQLSEAEVAGEHRYVYEADKNPEDYQSIAGVKTQFDLIELRPNGLFGLFGGPKDGKTRVAIAVARELAAMGYDVDFMDLENGGAEAEARFLQAELTDWKGYPVSMNYFYSGLFIHEDRIPDYCTKYDFMEATTLRKDDVVYIIQTWTEIQVNPDGTEREKMCIELSLFRSKVQSPTADPLEDTEEGDDGAEWKYLGPWSDPAAPVKPTILEGDRPDFDRDVNDPDDEEEVQAFEAVQAEYDEAKEDYDPKYDAWFNALVIEDFGIVLNRALTEIKENKVTVGQVRIDYLPAGDISEVERVLTGLMDDPKSDFFSRPGWRVLIVDWMQLLQNKSIQEIWKRTRENYKTLKSWQARHQMYVMVIDGVKDTSQLRKLYPNLDLTGTVGTTQTDFNVASSVLFCVSDEEKTTRTARLVAKATRYGGSGNTVQECLQVDAEYSTIEVIPLEDHKALNPELWTDPGKKKGRGKKEKNPFDEIELDD